jgi:hypothetical protein
VAALLNRFPPGVRQSVYQRSGRPETVRAEAVGRVRTDRVAEWIAGRYPRRRFPAVTVGAANGSLAHLCAALGAPLLPQTFLVPLRQRGRHVDEPDQDVALARDPAARLLAANPDVQLHQMQDPNQDRLMLRHITYFRLKWRRLPAAFERFLIERLDPGGTIVVSDCHLRWPVTRLAERHVFQFGGVGGVDADEYRSGSERIARYLERHASHRRRWDPPPADEDCPEAEWGFEPALLDDVGRLARRHGWRVVRLSYGEPDDLASPIAGLHRAWYRELGMPADRMLVESFALLDPWWALRTASPVSSIHGSAERAWSVTTYAWWASACPGVATARSSVLPSLTTSPSASARCSKSAPAPSGMYAVAPVRSTSAGRPETWSACRCVSKTATICAPWASASAT